MAVKFQALVVEFQWPQGVEFGPKEVFKIEQKQKFAKPEPIYLAILFQPHAIKVQPPVVKFHWRVGLINNFVDHRGLQFYSIYSEAFFDFYRFAVG